MQRKPLPLPPNQLTVTVRLLSDRWGLHGRTVIRVCRYHGVPELSLVPGGRILYPRDAIEDLETRLFNWN